MTLQSFAAMLGVLLTGGATASSKTATPPAEHPRHHRGRLGYPHASAYATGRENADVRRIAREGVLFRERVLRRASCTPSRASLLTGRAPHELGEGGNL